MSEVRSISILWGASLVVFFIINELHFSAVEKSLTPLLITSSLIYAYRFSPTNFRVFFPYLCFFSISVTSIFGFTVTLTGSHAAITNAFLFGLSFYTVSIAYFVASRGDLKFIDCFKISNPLLLITGPIALFVVPLRGRKFLRRLDYFFPFVIVGAFFFQVIAAPLTHFFVLIERVDIASSILFAIIFEIFVYANFCGLSLMIYGLFGIFGFRIPLNFRQPFSSRNLVDFWRGWHTSLSAVLKILFYAPLRRRFPPFVALLGVFISSALWHGVTVNFLIWGILHATIFLVTLSLLKRDMKFAPVFILVCGVILARLVFADSDTDRLLAKLKFRYDGFSSVKFVWEANATSKISLVLGVVLICIEFFFWRSKFVSRRNYKHLRTPVSMAVITLLSILLIRSVGGDYAVYGQR